MWSETKRNNKFKYSEYKPIDKESEVPIEKCYFITEHTENEKNPWYDTERTVILEEIHYLLSLLILLIQHHHFDLDPVEAWGVKKIA